MTTNEFVDFILHAKKDGSVLKAKDDAAIFEAAQLISGSFVSPLYGALWQHGFDMKTVTEHLEAMYDSGNHFGLVYFIFILADAVDYVMPRSFSELAAIDIHVPILSAAVIEDWLDYDATSEVEVIETD